MTPTQFQSFCWTLFGNNWQIDIATVLGVDAETIQKWENGETPIPRRIQEHIHLLLAADKLRTRTPGIWRRIPYGINLELVLCDGYPVALVHEHDASLVELLEHNE